MSNNSLQAYLNADDKVGLDKFLTLQLKMDGWLASRLGITALGPIGFLAGVLVCYAFLATQPAHLTLRPWQCPKVSSTRHRIGQCTNQMIVCHAKHKHLPNVGFTITPSDICIYTALVGHVLSFLQETHSFFSRFSVIESRSQQCEFQCHDLHDLTIPYESFIQLVLQGM